MQVIWCREIKTNVDRRHPNLLQLSILHRKHRNWWTNSTYAFRALLLRCSKSKTRQNTIFDWYRNNRKVYWNEQFTHMWRWQPSRQNTRHRRCYYTECTLPLSVHTHPPNFTYSFHVCVCVCMCCCSDEVIKSRCYIYRCSVHVEL